MKMVVVVTIKVVVEKFMATENVMKAVIEMKLLTMEMLVTW